MSGLEIILIVGAGIAIAKKLDDRKKRKLGQQPVPIREYIANPSSSNNAPPQITTNLRVEAQAGSRIRRANQQVPVEEEDTLPLYSPPSKDLPADWNGQGLEKVHLPTYDEAREEATVWRSNSSENSSRTISSGWHEANTHGSGPFTDDSRPSQSAELQIPSSQEALQTTFNDIVPASATVPTANGRPDSQKSSQKLKFWKRAGVKVSR